MAQLKSTPARAQDPPVDPSRYRDPLAARTQWTPARTGGTTLRTHELVQPQQGQLAFVPARMTKIISMAIGSAGVFGLIGLGVVSTQFTGAMVPLLWALGVLDMLLMAGFGYWFYRRWFSPCVFDQVRGQFWVGHTPPAVGAALPPEARAGRLSDIHAVQILRERCHSKQGPFWSHELNLVLRDGRRIHVVDHADAAALRAEAQRLAAWLKCALWDAIPA